MAISKTWNGTPYQIPETSEEGWGPEMTNYLADLADNAVSKIGSVSLVAIETTDITPTAGSTVTVSRGHHTLSPASAVTLSASTALGDGTTDGEVVILQGTSDTNTVTILNGANTSLNGHAMLGEDQILQLRWDASAGNWVEIGRS